MIEWALLVRVFKTHSLLALAHVFNQLGDSSPDVTSVENLKNAFNTIQHFIEEELISSGHDRSDGGLIVSLLEMAFAGSFKIL